MKYVKKYEAYNLIPKKIVGGYFVLSDNKHVKTVFLDVTDNNYEEWNRWRITNRKVKVINIYDYDKYNSVYFIETIIYEKNNKIIINFWINKNDIERELNDWQIENFEMELNTIKYNI